MPFDNCFGLDNDERILPGERKLRKNDPEESIHTCKLRSFSFLVINRKLLPQGQVLSSHFSNRFSGNKQRHNHQSEQVNHSSDDLSGNRKSSIIPAWTEFLGETAVYAPRFTPSDTLNLRHSFLKSVLSLQIRTSSSKFPGKII